MKRERERKIKKILVFHTGFVLFTEHTQAAQAVEAAAGAAVK